MLTRKIAKRLLQMVIVLICISFLTFLLTYLAPGDPASAMYEAAGILPTEEQLETARLAMGLDKPFAVQYGSWVLGILHGDLGTSFSKNLPVGTIIGQRLLPTLKMALLSLAIMLVISIPLGVLSAGRGLGLYHPVSVLFRHLHAGLLAGPAADVRGVRQAPAAAGGLQQFRV